MGCQAENLFPCCFLQHHAPIKQIAKKVVENRWETISCLLKNAQFSSADQSRSAFSNASTLATFCSKVWSRSMRVFTFKELNKRAQPMAWSCSWQLRIAKNTWSHSPSMAVPLGCSWIFKPAAVSTRSHVAMKGARFTPTPTGTTHKSTITFMANCRCNNIMATPHDRLKAVAAKHWSVFKT